MHTSGGVAREVRLRFHLDFAQGKSPVPTDVAFEPLNPETLRDPYAVYARLRETAPVVWHEPLNSWLLTRYQDCIRVFRDSRRFAADRRKAGIPVPESTLSIQSMDPPEHTSVRGLLVSAYRAQDMAAVEQRARRYADELLGRLAGSNGGELMTGFAAPLTLATICDFLGVPVPALDSFSAMSDAIILGMDAGLRPERAEPGAVARARLSALIATWCDPPPRTGMLGYLAGHAAAAGMSRDVLLNSVRVVFHAGYTSLYSAIGNAVLALLRHEVDLTWLRDSQLMDTAVEELFRYDGPVQANARLCTEDVELGGVHIRQGQVVLLLLGAANRDPEQFARPDELMLERQPNPHLAFGWGIHACVGALLAKAVVQAALASLSDRAPRLRLAGEPVHKPQATQRCLERLPVSFGA
jgi:cytochrome P450